MTPPMLYEFLYRFVVMSIKRVNKGRNTNGKQSSYKNGRMSFDVFRSACDIAARLARVKHARILCFLLNGTWTRSCDNV